MKLKTEKDVRSYIAQAVKKQITVVKHQQPGKTTQLNESIIGGLVSMGAIGGVMGLTSITEEDVGPNNPDLIAATQFADVIADYIEAHADEIAVDFVMKHDEDGAYPARHEDIDNMARSVAKKVMMQLNVEKLFADVIAQTYRTALG